MQDGERGLDELTLPAFLPQPGLSCLIAWTIKAGEMWKEGDLSFQSFCA